MDSCILPCIYLDADAVLLPIFLLQKSIEKLISINQGYPQSQFRSIQHNASKIQCVWAALPLYYNSKCLHSISYTSYIPGLPNHFIYSVFIAEYITIIQRYRTVTLYTCVSVFLARNVLDRLGKTAPGDHSQWNRKWWKNENCVIVTETGGEWKSSIDYTGIGNGKSPYRHS